MTREKVQALVAGCIRTAAVAGLLSTAVSGASAEALRIGLSADPTSLDPHYHNLTPNNQVVAHIFEALVDSTPDVALQPGLAESFKAIDDTTWEFKLRKGVKFHDGSDFDANDVVFSLCRVTANKVVNSPSPFTTYTQGIADVKVVDRHTVHIKTAGTVAFLPRNLLTVVMISDGLIGGEKVDYAQGKCEIKAPWPSTEDFNSGKNAIGTGPYKYAEFVKSDHILFNRYDGYWGKKPEWTSVRLRPITGAAPRMAALLSGDVDMIENPPTQDIPRIKSSGKYHVVSDVTVRLVHVGMDTRNNGKVPQGVSGTDGKNPFTDVRVRQAMSLAINRQAISERIMGGMSKPAGQFLDTRFFGSQRGLEAPKADPDRARKLLAEAGYPKGFTVMLTGPNNRYVNDAQIVEAIKGMWERVGIKTEVQTLAASTFFSKVNKGEYGVYLSGWGPRTAETSSPLRAIVGTVGKAKGWGVANPGEYSNAEVDSLIDKASATVDDEKRWAMLGQASKIAMDEYAVLPVHYELTPWALRNDLDYKPRADQMTFGFEVTRAKAAK